MSADRREQLRDRVRDLLDTETAERPPCPQILGIGLPEEVCESDEALKRWLACRAVGTAIDEDRDIEDALADAFEAAEAQCDHFDLPFPEQRETSFGPLQAQVERQQRLGEGGRPTRRGTGRAGAAPERDPEQATIGERPARLSEFGGGGEDVGPLGDRLPAELEDVVGEQVTVTIDGTEHTLPNSVATWERVGNASTPEWRSQNVNGHDAVIVDQQADGWRAIVGTAPRRGESLRNIDILRPIGPFGEAAAAAVGFMREHPDGRDGDDGAGGDCEAEQSQLRRAIQSARRRDTWPVQELLRPVNAAERAGCLTATDAQDLRDRIRTIGEQQRGEGDPTIEPATVAERIDLLLDAIERFFGGGQGNGSPRRRR